MGSTGSTLEVLGVNLFADIYNGKRVLVTGHTGFKGSWLSLWLTQLGAEVTGAVEGGSSFNGLCGRINTEAAGSGRLRMRKPLLGRCWQNFLNQK